MTRTEFDTRATIPLGVKKGELVRLERAQVWQIVLVQIFDISVAVSVFLILVWIGFRDVVCARHEGTNWLQAPGAFRRVEIRSEHERHRSVTTSALLRWYCCWWSRDSICS